MGFNGISGVLNAPGEIPWEIVVLFFGAGLIFVFLWGKKSGGLAKFTTVDLIYIGIADGMNARIPKIIACQSTKPTYRNGATNPL